MSKKPCPRGGFTALEVVFSSCAVLALSILLLSPLRSACGAGAAPARACRGTSAVVTARLESWRQQMVGLRMRLVDAYDRRFNEPVPGE